MDVLAVAAGNEDAPVDQPLELVGDGLLAGADRVGQFGDGELAGAVQGVDEPQAGLVGEQLEQGDDLGGLPVGVTCPCRALPRARTCGMAGIMQRLLDPIRAR